MKGSENLAFDQLLAAWRRREECRDSGDVKSLAEARFALDRARAEVQHVFTIR